MDAFRPTSPGHSPGVGHGETPGQKLQMGLKYGCPVKDAMTGLAVQCRGWNSIDGELHLLMAIESLRQGWGCDIGYVCSFGHDSSAFL
ncbi:hypothetical protein C5167_044773 [Papaver somniferum]|nr:hypothetical protein C5167_044773 [Papaver somniferum]